MVVGEVEVTFNNDILAFLVSQFSDTFTSPSPLEHSTDSPHFGESLKIGWDDVRELEKGQIWELLKRGKAQYFHDCLDTGESDRELNTMLKRVWVEKPCAVNKQERTKNGILWERIHSYYNTVIFGIIFKHFLCARHYANHCIYFVSLTPQNKPIEALLFPF